MATLEMVQYSPHKISVADGTKIQRARDTSLKTINALPQIFWANGSGWREANLWALVRASNGLTNIKTVHSNLSHLHKYAQWLEEESLQWQHFPMIERERVLVRWRKYLIDQRDQTGLLSPSTATQRMNATIHFYRFVQSHNLIGHKAPLWQDKQVILHFFDSTGFNRTMVRLSTNLAIPNRARHGLKLENGLMPLTDDQRQSLLSFTGKENNASRELDLMLKLGFFSGARLGTILDLKRGTIENAISDPKEPGLFYLSVGPGHKPYVATKFGVSGQIIVPQALLEELKEYINDIRRVKREGLATPENKELVFLTRFGNPYTNSDSGSGAPVGRAMVDLRRKAIDAGLDFVKHFHFHMTRATFGTSVTSLLLSQVGASEKDVLALVSSLMLHKDIETTLKYIKFVQQSRMKASVANEYSNAFLGLDTRQRISGA